MTTVLVIEDLSAMREFIIETLNLENFEVIVASNGLDGLGMAQKHLPDLILCDIVMPGLDGYGVLLGLHKDPATATIPFIFTTAKTEREELRLGMELGADDYLFKPFSSTELLRAIHTRLQKHAETTSLLEQKVDKARDSFIAALQDETTDDRRQSPLKLRAITFLIGEKRVSLPVMEHLIVGRVTEHSPEPQPDIDLGPFAAEEKGVSRHHLIIKRKGSHVYVSDMDSMNGTWLNGVRLQSNSDYLVNSRDQLRLGDLKIQVSF